MFVLSDMIALLANISPLAGSYAIEVGVTFCTAIPVIVATTEFELSDITETVPLSSLNTNTSPLAES